MLTKISIIGLGFVGNSILESFKLKNVNIVGYYDKFKNGGIGKLDDCLDSEFLFMALPTQYDHELGKYNKSAIFETCEYLKEKKYNGVIVIKSTVEPESIFLLEEKFPSLQFIHNPEFLTARTAFEDFHNQDHIVIGKGKNCKEEDAIKLKIFYKHYYPDAEISMCSSIESESMKIFVNCFYSVKIQFFNELYLLCKKNGSDYEIVKDLMLKNNWINPMHTTIPGPDGKLSYGGLCFPKDTNALLKYMQRNNNPSEVLKATINERNKMRDDHDNCSHTNKKKLSFIDNIVKNIKDSFNKIFS